MQRVLDWQAASGQQVCLVDYSNHYRTPLPARFEFNTFLPVRRGWRIEQGMRRAGLGALVERATASRLRAIADRVQPDLVHVHNIDARGLACARAGLGPLVLSAWGALGQLASEPNRRLAPSVRQTLAACDLLLVDAPALLAPAAALVKPAARVEHLPLGADTQIFRPGRTAKALEWRALFAIPEDAFVLLSPRLWAPFYNHQQILRAYALAFERFHRPTQLVFAGLGDGPHALPHMAAAWQDVEQTAAAATIRWLPRIRYDEMPTLYALSDAVVNYPSQDSLAATLVETAACQLPLITAMLPTYRGTFVETYGTPAEVDRLDSLAEAMVQVVNAAPAERSVRLAAARQFVARHYDDGVIQERLWQLYAQLAVR